MRLERRDSEPVLDEIPARGRAHLVRRYRAHLLEDPVRVAEREARGLEHAELERAKIQFVANQVYKRDSIFAQALEVGMLESAGLSFRDADRILEQVRTVTADEVRAAARRYLVEDALTVATLDPQPMDPQPVNPSTPRVRPGAGRH